MLGVGGMLGVVGMRGGGGGVSMMVIEMFLVHV